MTEEEKFQLLDDYINGSLSAEQKAIVNQELQHNPAFAQEIALHRDMLIGLEKAVDQEWKNHFALLDKQSVNAEEVTVPEAKIIPLNRTSYYWWSGLAACLLVGYFFYFLLNTGNKNEKLFAQYYEPYMIASVQRNAGAGGTKEQAMQAYENGNYQEAAKLFTACVSVTPPDVSCTFYLGLASIETKELVKAEKYLSEVVNQPANDYRTRARWYLALVYLKQEQTEKAAELLKQLQLEQGFYRKKATKLLQEL
jgi:hypothetical protein